MAEEISVCCEKCLREIIDIVVSKSGGKARLAVGEADYTTQADPDAGCFLKVNTNSGEKRVGRDLRLYEMAINLPGAAARVIGWFFREVILPLRAYGLTESYKRALERINFLVAEVCCPEQQLGLLG
jgi:hypothetical protein